MRPVMLLLRGDIKEAMAGFGRPSDSDFSLQRRSLQELAPIFAFVGTLLYGHSQNNIGLAALHGNITAELLNYGGADDRLARLHAGKSLRLIKAQAQRNDPLDPADKQQITALELYINLSYAPVKSSIACIEQQRRGFVNAITRLQAAAPGNKNNVDSSSSNSTSGNSTRSKSRNSSISSEGGNDLKSEGGGQQLPELTDPSMRVLKLSSFMLSYDGFDDREYMEKQVRLQSV
jgi:hypothetical protein